MSQLRDFGTDSHRTISKNSSGCRLLIGYKKCFVLLCPIVEQLFLSSFREFVHDGHCLDHGLSGSCTKEMHAVSKLSVWYKIPIWFQNVVCPKTKDAFPKIQAWACNRYSRLHRSLVLRNTREFLKDTTVADSHKTSHGKVNSHFFSLYHNYSNSLTLSNASELFCSWISIKHIQVHEDNKFCHYLFTSFTKREIRIFTGSRAIVRVGTQELFCPYLKTFVPPFLPTQLTAPGSPRMGKCVSTTTTTNAISKKPPLLIAQDAQ